jgi:hypothetical protein
MMDTVEVLQVIRTTLTRRGSGKDIGDPIRVITQYWSMQGELLVEIDPLVSIKPGAGE